MNLTINHDGETRQVDVDLRLDSMTLQELVRLEETLGPDRFDRLVETGESRSPTVLRAMVWAKVASIYPVALDEFDLDLGALVPILEGDPGVVIPMATPDGNTTEATVGKDQPRQGSGTG